MIRSDSRRNGAVASRSTFVADSTTRSITNLFVGRLWLLATGLAINVQIARLLDTTDLAAWFAVVALTTISAGISEVGAVQGSIRLLASRPDDLRHIARTSARLMTLSTLVVAALASAAGWILLRVVTGSADLTVLILISATVAAYSTQRWLAGIALGLGRPSSAQTIEGLISRTLLMAVLAVLMFGARGLDLAGALALQLASLTAPILFGILFVLRALRDLEHHRPATGGVSIATVWRLGLTRGITVFQTTGDVVIVSAILSNAETADFGVAWRLAVLIAIPQQVINTIAQHRLRQQSALGGIARGAELARAFAVISASIGAVVCATLIISGPALIGLLFGEQFAGAYPILVILSLGQVLNVAVGPVGNFLVANDRDHDVLIGAVIGALLLPLAVISLGHVWGTVGAALGSSIAVAATNGYWWFRARGSGHRTDVLAGTSLWAAMQAVNREK